MKTCKGITMISILIYIIAMLIVMGIIATVTSFFYTNIINVEDSSNNLSEITKFNMFFLQEVKDTNNDIIKYTSTSIAFLTGNTFTFQDNSIYLNSNKICENVKQFSLNVEEINNKKAITVLITIGENLEYTKTTKYVMN